jgi:hypothetical protein
MCGNCENIVDIGHCIADVKAYISFLVSLLDAETNERGDLVSCTRKSPPSLLVFLNGGGRDRMYFLVASVYWIGALSGSASDVVFL